MIVYLLTIMALVQVTHLWIAVLTYRGVRVLALTAIVARMAAAEDLNAAAETFDA